MYTICFFQTKTSIRPKAILHTDEDLDYDEIETIADTIGATYYE